MVDLHFTDSRSFYLIIENGLVEIEYVINWQTGETKAEAIEGYEEVSKAW